jgi:hypothetical protein
MKAKTRLERIESNSGGPLPFKILTKGMPPYGVPDDGLYHEGDKATYTKAELAALSDKYKVIILDWDDGPARNDGIRLQLTWGDD